MASTVLNTAQCGFISGISGGAPRASIIVGCVGGKVGSRQSLVVCEGYNATSQTAGNYTASLLLKEESKNTNEGEDDCAQNDLEVCLAPCLCFGQASRCTEVQLEPDMLMANQDGGGFQLYAVSAPKRSTVRIESDLCLRLMSGVEQLIIQGCELAQIGAQMASEG